MFLDGLRDRLGRRKGLSVWNDLRQRQDPETPVSVDGRFPYAKLPKRRSGNVVIDNGSFKPSAGAASSAAAGAGAAQPPGEQRADGHRAALDHRQAADGRRPADRLLLPRPHARDGPQGPGLAGARRDVGAVPRLHPDRPRRGLRVDAHLGRRGHHRPLRRDASAAAADQVPLQGQVPADDVASTPASSRPAAASRSARSRSCAPCTAPWSGYAKVSGRTVALSRKRSSYGRDTVDQLLYRDLTRGQRALGSGASSGPPARRRRRSTRSTSIASDIAMYTSGRLCRCAPKGVDSGPARPTAAGATSGAASSRAKAHPQGGQPARRACSNNWNNKPARGFPARRRPVRATAPISAWTCSTSGIAAPAQARPRVDDRGDERRRHPGRARGGVPARAVADAQRRRPRSQRPGAADARPARGWRRDGGSRLDRDLDGKIDAPGRRCPGRGLGRLANAASGAACSGRSWRTSSTTTLHGRFNLPPGGPVQRLAHVHGQGPPDAARAQGAREVQEPLLRPRQDQALPRRPVGARSTRRAPSSPAPRAPIPRRGARTRSASGSSSCPACCRSRCATPIGRAASSRSSRSTGRASVECRRRAIREVAGARQRLRDRRGGARSRSSSPPSGSRAFCAPHTGVGSDGILLLSRTEERGFVAALRIFNPDGSEAELSGNGVREAVMYLRRHGWADSDTFSISTAAGEVRPAHHRADTCTVDMGRAKLASSKDFPSGGRRRHRHAHGRPAASCSFQFVSVGNPQCSIEVEEGLEELDLAELGRADREPRAVPEPHQRVVLAPRGRRRDPGADLRARGGGDDVVGHRRHRRGRGRRGARGSTAP